MNRVDAVADGIVAHSKLVIVLLLVAAAAVGAGATQLEESSSLSQFETDSVPAEKLSYIESNFTADEDTTTVQVIVRRDDALSKRALLDQLRFQQALRDSRTINRTLASEPPTGIANALATAAIRQDEAAELQARAAQLQAQRQRLNETGARLSDALNRTRALQARYDALNRSLARGDIDNATYRERAAGIERQLAGVRSNATASLSANATATFTGLVDRTRSLQGRLAELNASYARGDIDRETYRNRAAEVEAGFAEVYAGIERVLAPQARQLRERGQRLQADRAELRSKIENAERPPLADQIDRLESMNASTLDATIERVLGQDSEAGAFALMPTGYEPGSTSAQATVMVVTQRTEQDLAQGSATPRIERSQLAIKDLADEQLSGETMTFGVGVVSDEIDRSMEDSLQVVGPMAVVFVLVVLTIAYRDLLDIVLGVVGIGVVLAVTFGFMGWAGIKFNQLFVAIPVLLIGLSIDYAIHVFMRHREARATDGLGVRGSMATALAGVGVALLLVTATTVIGFLSNLTSPVGPIREFGVVSAVGIAAALVVFGALIPALKSEADALLESYGIDRRKRAFGTGGGAFSRVLSGGATLARRAPWVVILATLAISAAGAYGAVQVDTSFQNKDFIAEEPPEWMDSLPEGIQPGEYSMRATLEYVNENFLRQDSQVEFLVEGDVATERGVERIDRIERLAAGKGVTVRLSNGEADVTSPLTLVRDVADANETFNETVAAADTDGDGVPDRNVEGVYAALFDAAPDRAQQVLHRDDGEYRAARVTVSVRGGARGGVIKSQMDDVAATVGGQGFVVTATGTPIVNEVVQDDLLRTVVESLLVTLVVSFVFLMIVYRLTEGSATLGLVTLLPVVFNVSWILGTMYLLDIPFNVLTGMITSLTIGLGVAYSIHISERYGLELDRQDSAWSAMETAVTGTGGALLGSAATTVGGFGVLVFAILPPLQQFGFITGLTIVYAFLASVFILPSLLVVWTRYLGPAEMLDAESGRPAGPGELPAGTGTGTGTGGEPAPSPNGGPVDASGGDDAATPEGVAAPNGSTAAATGAASDASPETRFATRTLAQEYALPGGVVSATVTLPSVAGRVVLAESVPGAASIDRVAPAPLHRVAADGRIYVVWDLDEPTAARVEYSVDLDSGAPGEAVGFEGEVLLPDHEVSVGGDGSALVVRDLIDRLVEGPVTETDLRTAGRYLAAGDLTREGFERVYHAWLDERATGGGADE